jgi:hypothetical protein
MEGMLAPKQQRESGGQFGLKMALLVYVIGAPDFPQAGIPK